MAATFTAASVQFLTGAAMPITTYPFSAGVWIKQPSTGDVSLFFMTDGGGPNYFALALFNGNPYVSASDTNGEVDADLAGITLNSGKWVFLLGRWVSATNRWCSLLQDDGSTVHAQNTTSRTPAGLTTMYLGSYDGSGTGAFDGSMAEFFLLNADVQPDGAQTQDTLLRQLAYGGPLSLPHLAGNVIDYRSLRKHPTCEDAGEIAWGAKGKQTWINNGVTTGPHPPLPYWRAKPGQNKRVLMI